MQQSIINIFIAIYAFIELLLAVSSGPALLFLLFFIGLRIAGKFWPKDQVKAVGGYLARAAISPLWGFLYLWRDEVPISQETKRTFTLVHVLPFVLLLLLLVISFLWGSLTL